MRDDLAVGSAGPYDDAFDIVGTAPNDCTDWDELRQQLVEICEIEAVRARAATEALGLLEPDAILCKCKQVSRARIVGLVEAGLSRQDIARMTGAGQTCGGCTLQLDTLVGATSLAAARLIDREVLDVSHTRFTFEVPEHDEIPHPGDHVIVEATIYGRALTRTYTLTGWNLARRNYDIIVRYEPNGVFSRWLHDFADSESRFRLSRPAGAPDMRADEPQLFLAAGIGITPVCTRLKALQQRDASHVRLHWSARFQQGSRLTDEVVRLIDSAPGAVATLRDTVLDGRLSRDEIVEMAPYTGTGKVHVCGPVTYTADVSEALIQAGWPKDRIVRESFVAAVSAPVQQKAIPFDAHTDPVVAESFSLRATSSLLGEATAFLKQFYVEHGAAQPFEARLAAIEHAIAQTGTYEQTYDELAYGARLAWRNSTRCVGRFFWQMLTVRDMRHVETEEGVFAAIVEHIRWATNGGDLRPAITVFRPGAPAIRVLNPQLILYAGYRQTDGSIIGDPNNVEFTEFVRALGWEGPRTPFDILPLVIRIGSRPPRLFEFPEGLVLEVALDHPERAAFAEIGLKWFALPAVADMALDLGGLQYTAAPSSGVYMGTEIGSFNLSDPRRYDMLPRVAEALGYAIDDDNPLWRDQALLEVNRAVLHSFRRAGVRILDHHALSKYFMRFMALEKAEQRPVYGHWPWIVPPMSANLSDIWHDKTLKNVIVKPNYFYQKRGGYLESLESEMARACPVHELELGQTPPDNRCPAHI